ncbi:TnsA-like heteromeric transposase endonuclease subunit [Cellulomonas sp. Leaf334]|uniref:TnsA-like heteromeric transposase endonuclease subunit n=1 Tax=Cellulomonas sp. Leaf334 TaxID=1736339 RepID=UPI0006FE5E06|nr:TnsA-like heteromeric transposase endonuclease subunit [Cellulomonas sp. Leaf334]KQR08573.1 hypothetical protein ASF78_20240 [Cellulomonas sp. Leaf334]
MEPIAVRAAYATAEGLEQTAELSAIDLREVAWGAPVRVPPSYAGQRNYPGLFWSATNRDHVVYESRLELEWLWLADFDPTIVRLAAQPLRIVGRDGPRERVRYPDFLAVDADGRGLVVDVKPEAMLADPAVQASLAWTSRTMGDAGLAYAVWTGAPDVVLRNVRLLASVRRPGMVPEHAIRAAAEICPITGSSIGELEARLAATADVPPRAAIFAALWKSRLRCDMTHPLSTLTQVVPV